MGWFCNSFMFGAKKGWIGALCNLHANIMLYNSATTVMIAL
jgi:hypothetical protein